MATTSEVKLVKRVLLDDGRIQITEETNCYIDGKFSSGRKDDRYIELGDDVSGEDEVTRDAVDGKLHTVDRVTARQETEETEET